MSINHTPENDVQCRNCQYAPQHMGIDGNGWCYMFRERPEGYCCQETEVIQRQKTTPIVLATLGGERITQLDDLMAPRVPTAEEEQRARRLSCKHNFPEHSPFVCVMCNCTLREHMINQRTP